MAAMGGYFAAAIAYGLIQLLLSGRQQAGERKLAKGKLKLQERAMVAETQATKAVTKSAERQSREAMMQARGVARRKRGEAREERTQVRELQAGATRDAMVMQLIQGLLRGGETAGAQATQPAFAPTSIMSLLRR